MIFYSGLLLYARFVRYSMALCISFIADSVGSLTSRPVSCLISLTSAFHFCLLNSRKYRNMRFAYLYVTRRIAEQAGMRISFPPSFTTNQRSVTYIGSLCFVSQACTTSDSPAAAMGCQQTLAWLGRLLYVSTPENSRGRAFNADNHEQQKSSLKMKR